MISAIFGVGGRKEKAQDEPHKGVIRFDQRLLEQPKATQPQRTQVKVDSRLVELILARIELALNEMMGQAVDVSSLTAQLKQLTNEYLASLQIVNNNEHVERSLIETKEKYNELVDTLNTNRSRLKEFHDGVYSSLEDLTLVLGQLLDSREFEMPLKHIRKGISDMSVETVEKYMRLVGKLVAQEHAKTLQQVISKKESEQHEEVRTLKASVRGLESEVATTKESRNLLQRQLRDLENSKKDLAERLKHSEQSLKMSEQMNSQNQRERSQLAEKDLQQKSKLYEEKIRELEATCKQHTTTQQSLHSRIESLERLLEEERLKLKLEGESCDKKYLANIRKLTQEKVHFEEINAELQIEVRRLRTEQAISIENALKENGLLTTGLQDRVAKLEKELSILAVEKDQLAAQLSTMVERDVLRQLVQGFTDESKDWSVKAQIQKKLFLVLGIAAPQPEPKKSGWFGLF